MTLAPDISVGDRYTLIERIAVGGMGEVWRARDSLLDRLVAVKVLKTEFATDPSFLEWFRNEARHTASLSHPGIANVFDYGEFEGTAYLVMELVNGEPLSALLGREGALDARRTLDIVGQAALALQAAHEGGVIHRDVKPGNLLVRPDGVVKVTDFGIARATGAAPLTQTGLVVGTAGYLSPEQAGGHKVTPASDIYSLGVVAYECLAGRRPFDADSPMGVALAHINHSPPPLPREVPPLVSDFVMRAMEKDPARRQPSAGDLGRTALALDAQLDGSDPTATAAAAPTPTARMPAPTAMTATAAADDDDAQRRRVRNIFIAIGVAVVALGFLLLRSCAGESTAVVPKVTGKSFARAAAALEARGFDVRRHNVDNQAPSGTVIRQSVHAGKRVPTARPVTLTVSGGPAEFVLRAGDYVGRPFDAVAGELQARHLTVARITGPATAAAGTVTAIAPVGSVEEGSTVTVTVAGASEPVKPPKGHKHGKPPGHDH
jgi:serine/threonine-protein kinase